MTKPSTLIFLLGFLLCCENTFHGVIRISNSLKVKNKFYFYWHFMYLFRHGQNRPVFYFIFLWVCLYLRDLKCCPSTVSHAEKSWVYNKSVDKKRLVLIIVRGSCLFITWSCCILTIFGKNKASNMNCRPSPGWRLGVSLLCTLFLCSDL